MKIGSRIILFLFVFVFICGVGLCDANDRVIIYFGSSDISGGAALGDDMFAVADDEDNVLKVYGANSLSGPIASYDMSRFIVEDTDHPEADIEGATIVGDRVYWISSHGRNKDGKLRSNRYRFFATKVEMKKGGAILSPVGVPCSVLAEEMVKAKATQGLSLGAVSMLGEKKISKLAPKKNGLNIEGLCSAADGNSLYIGFRNPLYFDRADSKSKAIIIPLVNPSQVVEKGHRPEFDEPVLLDLGGLGIRSIEYSHFYKSYLIIAGPSDGGADFALYRWSGAKDAKPVLVREFPENADEFTPEGLIVFEESGRVLVFSDDGTVDVSVSGPSECEADEMTGERTCPNKYLTDQSKKSFRGIWFSL